MNMHLVRTPGPYQRKRVDISIRLAELFYLHGDDYYFKWCPFNLQDMAFCLLKDGLSHYERIAIAKLPEASENRK